MKYLRIVLELPIGFGKPKMQVIDGTFIEALAMKLSNDYGLRIVAVKKTVKDFYRYWSKRHHD